MYKYIFALSFLFTVTALGSVTALATQAPNLQVLAWQGSSTPLVESPYQYTSRVQNTGNQTATGVIMTIEFPLTNTSPSKFILGKLSGVQTPQGTCSVASNKVVCNFGSIGQNQTRQVTFTYEFQVATTLPTFKSSVTTTSSNEVNVANNTLSTTPSVRYPDNIVDVSGPQASYRVTSCTGRGLTSFYECEMSPGSTQGFDINFIPGGTLLMPAAPSYFGFWNQNGLPLNKTLHFSIEGGSGTEVVFDGFASNGACFKGIATFPSSTVYTAAYRVCEQ
jgi:Domain of unknown function DUF11